MPAGLFDAYLSGDARALYGLHFGGAEDRLRAVKAAVRPLAPEVAAALEAQQARFAPSPSRAESLRALRAGAAAVVTGQQMGLFLGPLFTLYKAATAVKAARALEVETGARVVPVFWLQTEDHDLEEIAVCHAPRAHGAPLSLSLPVPAGNRVSVAHCRLPDRVVDCLRELQTELQRLPHAEEHLAHLARHYRPGAGWSNAFGGMLADLFAATGLVLIDPRDPALAAAAAPVHRRALLDAESISAALVERARAIERQGWDAPVHIREGAPLSFFHPEGAEGPRYRLAPVEGGFELVGGEQRAVHSRESLVAALEQDPLRFSTSALLRPIVQDALLPTAAYVGGPAEVCYFGQLAPLYAAFGRAMPLVVPRARMRILEERTLRLLASLGLEVDAAAEAEDALLARLSGASEGHRTAAALEDTLAAGFERALADAVRDVGAEEMGLGTALRKTSGSVRRAASKLARNYELALLRRNRSIVDGVRQIKADLYPEGHPQERFFGLSAYAARHGEENLLERVLDAISPFDPTPRDLRP